MRNIFWFCAASVIALLFLAAPRAHAMELYSSSTLSMSNDITGQDSCYKWPGAGAIPTYADLGYINGNGADVSATFDSVGVEYNGGYFMIRVFSSSDYATSSQIAMQETSDLYTSYRTGGTNITRGLGILPSGYYRASLRVECSPALSFISFTGLTLSALPNEPVVVVPGIMGSVLRRASDGAEVWPNVQAMAVSFSDDYLDDLALDPNLIPSDILREASGSLNIAPFINIDFGKTFYGTLINALEQDGYEEGKNLFVAPYDWRLDVGAATNALASKIAAAVAVSPNGKIDIIAHSMGGLLVKKYLAGATDTSFLDALILAGVPQLGAPKAFKILQYGDNLGINFGPFDVLNPDEIKKVAQSMASVYELLPSRKYIEVSGGYVQDFRNGASEVLGYDETQPFFTNTTLTGAADLFHQGLDAQAVHASRVYNIVGCLNPTVTGFDLYDNGGVDIERGNGDGTVPVTSAMNLTEGFSDYFVLGDETGIDHMGLVSDARTLTLVRDILDGASTTTLPSGISTSLADCMTPGASPAETMVDFSVHGSAALNVYDAAGRHTGPLPTGDIELGIPGSQYEKIGDNTFVLVSATSTYKVLVQGTVSSTASSTATIKVKEYKGSTKSKQVNYPSVSLVSASATAELDFTGPGNDTGLTIDENGDGTSDTTSQPIIADDVVPSDIILPVIPAIVVQYSTTTIVFSASDSSSGIATVTAMLNGMAVTNGETVTFDHLGVNVFVITAIDRAGNQRTEEIDFTVVAPGAGGGSAGGESCH